MFCAHSVSQCSAVTMWNDELDLEGQFWNERARQRVCNPHREIYSHKRKTKWKRKQSQRLWGVDGQPLCSLAACQQACVRTFPQPEKMQILLWDAAPFLQRQLPKNESHSCDLLHRMLCCCSTNKPEYHWMLWVCRLHLDAMVNVLNYPSIGITF